MIPDQIVIDGEWLVQVSCNKQCLLVSKGKVIAANVFMMEVSETVWIVPGKPMRELLPLKAHEAEVRALVLRNLNIVESPRLRG